MTRIPLSSGNREILLVELRRIIDKSAQASCKKFKEENPEVSDEVFIKHLHQYASDIFFEFFSIVDGVADPEEVQGMKWTGVALVDSSLVEGKHIEFLHDEPL